MKARKRNTLPKRRNTPGDPFTMQSTPDLFGWADFAVGTMPGYAITVRDTNAWANPIRFYRIFSHAPAP